MSKRKLKVDDVEVESFETAAAEDKTGTVKANELETADFGTCWGQTAQCTACPPRHCY